MTRQERRRQSRNKKTTYNLTPEQIATMSFESQKQAYVEMKNNLNGILKEEAKRCTLEAFTQTFYIPLLVLRNMGWGKVRLERFAREMIDQWEMYEEKFFSSQDVKEMLKDETGVDIKFELNYKDQKARIALG